VPFTQVRIVRIFNTYGPRMALDDGRVVSNFVSQALTDQPITIYGDGKQVGAVRAPLVGCI
jgi:UDP-glucuronate decarboxylase